MKKEQLPLTPKDLKTFIQDLNKCNNVSINITIEKVIINLDESDEVPLNFFFDKVEVKQNSGNINFGNTFNSKKNGTDLQNEKKEEDEISIKIYDEKIPFSFKPYFS